MKIEKTLVEKMQGDAHDHFLNTINQQQKGANDTLKITP